MQPKLSVLVARTPFCNGKLQGGSKGWFTGPSHVAVLKFEYCRRKTHLMSWLNMRLRELSRILCSLDR